MAIQMNNQSAGARDRKKTQTRILAIETDRCSRNFLNQTLGEFGTVKLIEPGSKVFETAKKYKPNLVVLGLEEHDLNGLCLCRWLKETRPEVCILLITNPESSGELVHEFNMVDGQLSSPFDPRDLRSLLCQLLEAQLRANSSRSEQKRYENIQRHFDRCTQHTADLKLNDPALSALIMMAAMKDQGATHLKRVEAYSQCIAMQLRNESGYSDEITDGFLSDLNGASQLHDIGNVVIGDELLNHSGSLTEQEFKTIKMHTTLGADLLKQASQDSPESTALKMAEQIARSHHEYWDGNGYPCRISGKRIPLAARIVAVADVFDALTSNRSFRDSFTPELARNVIGNESAKQFDPIVVEAFLATFENIQATGDAIDELAEVEMCAWPKEKVVPSSSPFNHDSSTKAIEGYREQQRELIDRFRDAMSSRIESLKSAYFDGKHESVAQVAGELHQTAAQWGLADATQCALELRNHVDRSASVEQIGLRVQRLLDSINSHGV